jgi:hypothetical protein
MMSEGRGREREGARRETKRFGERNLRKPSRARQGERKRGRGETERQSQGGSKIVGEQASEKKNNNKDSEGETHAKR